MPGSAATICKPFFALPPHFWAWHALQDIKKRFPGHALTRPHAPLVMLPYRPPQFPLYLPQSFPVPYLAPVSDLRAGSSGILLPLCKMPGFPRRALISALAPPAFRQIVRHGVPVLPPACSLSVVSITTPRSASSCHNCFFFSCGNALYLIKNFCSSSVSSSNFIGSPSLPDPAAEVLYFLHGVPLIGRPLSLQIVGGSCSAPPALYCS